jgi:prenyltransferase beta subunit
MLLLITTSSGQSAENEAGATDGIDLQLTGALVKQWGARASFPESVTFAYYHVYMARALGLAITPESRQLITGYLVACQQPNGGFTPETKHARTASVIYTYYAVKTLELLGENKAIDRNSAVRFLRNRVQPDGGIVATAREGDQANLATTYYGVEALTGLGAIDSVDKPAVAAFIQRYREDNRGFGLKPGGPSTPLTTFMAVRALKSLSALSAEVGDKVVAYLLTTRYSGLVKDQTYRLLPDIKSMASLLETLSLLSATQKVALDSIHAFISSLYIRDNGGFGPRPGVGASPPSTYYAILCLVRLGKLPDPTHHRPTARSTAGS